MSWNNIEQFQMTLLSVMRWPYDFSIVHLYVEFYLFICIV